MSVYGMRILDTSGNSVLLTPRMGKIIAGGTQTMGNSLNGDGTYGVDISLSPFTNVPLANLGVIVHPTKFSWRAVSAGWIDGTSYPYTWYADSATTYYTKAADGVMSTWTAGDMAIATPNNWDHMCNAFPLAGWDYLDATTTFSSVRLWAAMAHIVYDYSASAYKTVYTIGSTGVSEVSYMVVLKNA